MAITTIPWGDGSGDNIYLSAPSQTGDQSVSVTSDPNTGAARSKVVTFSAVGVTPVSLTINQAAGGIAPVFYDYLVFDGTAYIDTDIVPSNDASFLGNFGTETLTGSGAGQRLFLVPATGSTQTGVIISPSQSTSTYRYFSMYYGSNALGGNRRNYWSTTRYDIFLTPNKFGYGGTVVNITRGGYVPAGALVIGQNAAHSGQAYTGRIKTFYVYGDDAKNVANVSGFANYTPVATLRPCTYNGEAGLWNVETSKFYGNTAGAGTLSVANN